MADTQTTPSLSQLDLSLFSEEEKESIAAVMKRAEEFQKKEEDALKQPMEGPLSKWTNLMKGWQFRWFTLDPDSGMLEYYVDGRDKKKQGPRGSVHLAGAVIAPSDEDSFTFSVNAANGDVFKLRAKDAKERQHWITRLRSVAEHHESTLAQRSPPLQNIYHASNMTSHSATSLAPTQSTSSTELVGVTEMNYEVQPTPSHSQHDVDSGLKESCNQLREIRDVLHEVEDSQLSLITHLEKDPTETENLDPLSHEVLLLKATSQATLSSLHQCLAILQQQIAKGQSSTYDNSAVAPKAPQADWVREATTGTPPGSLNSTTSQEEEMRNTPSFKRKLLPTRPKSTASVAKNGLIDSASLSCCERASAEMLQDSEVFSDSEVEADELRKDIPDEPEPESLEEKHKSVILHLISQLKLGMDLTKVVLPTFILEPRSLLEMYADFFAHPHLFMKIPDGLTAEDRMLSVVEFYLTSFHVGRHGSLAKKPYNPILGETFRCSWDVDVSSETMESTSQNTSTANSSKAQKGKVLFIAEQVSHHPPVSSFYSYCPSKQMCMNAHLWTKSKFYGMSIGVAMIGEGTLSLLTHEEDYVITFPSAYCRSILTYPWSELGGKVQVTCAKTGYSASATFHTRPFYGGKLHRLTGEIKHTPSGRVICKINGEWNGQLEFTHTSQQEESKVIDTKKIPVSPKRVKPISQQSEYESRRLWQTVTTALKRKDIDAATVGKHSLEERQRKEASERKEQGVEWRTKLFHKHGDGWMYNKHMKQTQTQTADAASKS